jgi:hypothetical protein
MIAQIILGIILFITIMVDFINVDKEVHSQNINPVIYMLSLVVFYGTFIVCLYFGGVYSIYTSLLARIIGSFIFAVILIANIIEAPTIAKENNLKVGKLAFLKVLIYTIMFICMCYGGFYS